MGQLGTLEDEAFGFRLVIAPPSYIEVKAPPETPTDLLQASAAGGVSVEVEPESDGTFAIRKRDRVMALVEALRGGKRLLLVFVDRTRNVNTAVAAIGHDGFDETLRAAFAAADASNGGSPCP
jgi:hypothetical protein